MTSSVRQARTNDVPSIHRLLDYYAARGQLLPRSLDQKFDASGSANSIQAALLDIVDAMKSAQPVKITGSMETLALVSTDTKNGMVEMSVGVGEIFSMIESVSQAGVQTDERVKNLEAPVARFKTA